MQDNKGMTLIEMMVVIVIMLICLMAVYNTFIFQQKASVREESITQIQEVGQQLLNLLRKDIMMAGYGVDKKLALYIEDGGNNGPDRLYINDWEFIDEDELLRGIYGQATVSNHTGTSVTLNKNLDLDGDGEDDFKFRTNTSARQWAIIGTSLGETTVRRIDGTTPPNSLTLNTSVNINDEIAPAKYYFIQNDILYLVDRTTGAIIQPLADNVVDMQIACRDKDGTWYCDGTGACPMNPFDPENIALVRITIVMRTGKKTSSGSNTGRPAIENRTAGPADEYTYRVYTTEVAPRNLLF